ncbi:hypothetical protein LD39_14810, partial [Halobacillus sp. BBL2006]
MFHQHGYPGATFPYYYGYGNYDSFGYYRNGYPVGPYSYDPYRQPYYFPQSYPYYIQQIVNAQYGQQDWR